MNTMPLEAATRQLIDANLKNLGWQFMGKSQNVYLEQPKTEVERKKLVGKRPDYVLYSKDSDTPLIVIEAKKKGERIDTALEQGVAYAKELNAPLVFATDGVFCKSYHTLGNTTPKLNGEDVDEFLREITALKFLKTWEVNTVSSKVQYDRRELIKIFDEANNMLRGDGLRAGIERFGEFANILFLKLISESEQIKHENGTASSFDLSCSWDTIKNIAPTARIDYINTMVYQKLNTLYQTEIFTPLTIRDNSILKEIMDKLDPLTLTDVDSDVKGDAFEYFLKASTASKNDLGEYFTPRHIVKTMVRLVNPQIGEKVYDPFCGTGGFLIESFRYIYNNMARNPKNEKTLKEETIYGNEITNTARITKMNMILAGDGHSNIHMKDSLANPVEGEYDIVIANMPYSQNTKYGNLYDLPSTNGDSVCVQHCMKAINKLSENGRMALVVPEGFLFRKDLAKTREYLLEHAQLQSIISLPQGVFLPYTGVKTNIIYASKINQRVSTNKKRKDFWYFNVKSDGYTLDNHRRKLDAPSDLTKYEEYRKLGEDQANDMIQVGFEIIPLDKVCKNSFILVGSKYRKVVSQTVTFPLISLGDNRYFEIFSGGTPSSTNSDYWGGNVNWITLTDLPVENLITKIYSTDRTITTEGLDNSSAKLLPVNTVVVSSRATIGRIGITKTELATNQGFKNIVIKDSSLIMPEYLAFILTGKRDEMLSLASGATFKEISKENFKTIQIPIPSLKIQQQIVDELESYQRIIDGSKSILDNYKPMIKIDSSWKNVRLGDVCELLNGYAFKSELYSDSGFQIVKIGNVQCGKFVLNKNISFYPIEHTLGLEQYILQRGDILISMTGTQGKEDFGNLCMVDVDSKLLLNQRVGKFQNIKDIILDKYLYFVLQTDLFRQHIFRSASGVRQGNVSKTDIESFCIPLPSLDIQKQIILRIEEEQALIEPSIQLIEVFTKKIQNKVNEIWGESNDSHSG